MPSRKRRARPRFALRGVLTIPTDPGKPVEFAACYPDEAKRLLADVPGIVLTNPPS